MALRHTVQALFPARRLTLRHAPPMTDTGTQGSANLSALVAALGHRFHDPRLLVQALTHASARPAKGERIDSNERLEFLGDRVLGLVIAEMLLARFPKEEEGAIARRFAALVRREALAQIAVEIGLEAHLLLSRGERAIGGAARPSLLADACEAVIAALYLDGGLAAAEGFIAARWTPLLDRADQPPRDPKTALQEWAQARGLALPAYGEVARRGPGHAPIFVIEVAVEGAPSRRAEGPSKRTAEQAAAAALFAQELRPLCPFLAIFYL